MIVGEFKCEMCQEWRFLKDFAFSFKIEDDDPDEVGVCGWCAGCY